MWPSGMRRDGDRTSRGSFLAILKTLHKNHQHPSLPFIIVSTEHGLAVKSRTKQFKRLALRLTGKAQAVPTSLLKTSSDTALHQALRNFVSIIEWSESCLLVLWGPLALMNHDCSSKLQLAGPLGDHQAIGGNGIYRWGLQCREGVIETAWPSLVIIRKCFAKGLKAVNAHCTACLHLAHACLSVTALS